MSTLPFRISIIDYLNSAPLNYGFKRGLGFEHFHLKFQVPSACADQLRSGEVDAGLISSIEFLRIPGLRIVPGLCIASPKRVRSVVILSKVPPEKIRSLALDTSSRSSVVLGQILLRERYGTSPQTRAMAPDLAAMLEQCDAALVIGDPAMRARKEGLIVLDLAEEWHAWTGLPFVFALWMVREGAPELKVHLRERAEERGGVEPSRSGSVADRIGPLGGPECPTAPVQGMGAGLLPGGVAPLFHKSLEMGQENLTAIIDEAWHSIGWTKLELREYLTENISYHLGEAEQKSLTLFFDKAVRQGFAPEGRALRFL